jgi:hypothetical protein
MRRMRGQAFSMWRKSMLASLAVMIATKKAAVEFEARVKAEEKVRRAEEKRTREAYLAAQASEAKRRAEEKRAADEERARKKAAEEVYKAKLHAEQQEAAKKAEEDAAAKKAAEEKIKQDLRSKAKVSSFKPEKPGRKAGMVKPEDLDPKDLRAEAYLAPPAAAPKKEGRPAPNRKVETQDLGDQLARNQKKPAPPKKAPPTTA